MSCARQSSLADADSSHVVPAYEWWYVIRSCDVAYVQRVNARLSPLSYDACFENSWSVTSCSDRNVTQVAQPLTYILFQVSIRAFDRRFF